ncbi:hypothetical protein ACVRWQ_00610 [Streptococcus phocae subsp. salmonis]
MHTDPKANTLFLTGLSVKKAINHAFLIEPYMKKALSQEIELVEFVY